MNHQENLVFLLQTYSFSNIKRSNFIISDGFGLEMMVRDKWANIHKSLHQLFIESETKALINEYNRLSRRGFRAIVISNSKTKLINIIKAEAGNYVSTSQLSKEEETILFSTKNFHSPKDDCESPIRSLDQVPTINKVIIRNETKNENE